jgi:ribonucleoside-diphosphate reductase alpha chain
MNHSQEILSQVITWSKYANYLEDKKRRENWTELCQRNKEMHIKKYPKLKDEINHVYENFVLTKKVLPSMRSLQFAGDAIERSNSRMFNCSFVAIDDIAAFWEIFFLSLGGTGCGYSVQKHHVEQLPVVQGPTEKHRRFLIGDSVEGWSDAIKVLVKAYFYGKSDPVFDYSTIRQKGLPIKSGGKAPGPDPLRICIDNVRAILNNAIGRKLKPIEVS